MIDFQKARRDAFDFLSHTESIVIWEEKIKKNRKYEDFEEVWKVITEIYLPDNSISSLELFIAIPPEFPIVLPRIYVSENDRGWIGFIAHINATNFVCVFDEEFILTDPSQPGRIVKACIEKAQEIIEIGITGSTKRHFTDEFLAYWEEKNDEKDLVINGLSILDSSLEFSNNTIKFLYLAEPFGGYNFIFYNDPEEIKIISAYLKSKKIAYSEHDAFCLGDCGAMYPPFGISNGQVHTLVKDNFRHALIEFEKYVNKVDKKKIILLSIQAKEERIIFGYYLPPLSTTRKGFRNISLIEDFTKFHKSDRVARIKFDTLTKKRLIMRTDGSLDNRKSFFFTFIGLGSIGANLLLNMLSLDISELNLIDPEILTVDNINRHTLGMDDVSKFKVDALKQKIESKDPLLKVNAYRESIVKIIQDQSDFLNKSDLIFMAIGKTNLEAFVCDAINNGLIIKPLIIIWIEPYLYGGHCLYFVPGQPINYTDLYERGRYKYNIISNEEYESSTRELQLAEAGCQGSYTPYGKKDILLFMAKLIPILFDLIDTKTAQHVRITWRGFTKDFIRPPIKISEFGSEFDAGEIQSVFFS